MKIPILHHRHREDAYALYIVMGLSVVSLIILASTMNYTYGTAKITARAIRQQVAVVAAEAATEKVVSEMAADFANTGATLVTSKLGTYRTRIPTVSENEYWSRYLFRDGSGNGNKVSVVVSSNWACAAPLISQYKGLKGYAATFQIKASAQDVNAASQIIKGAVQQDVQLALVAIFQFAIFYNMDLEINPGASMTIGGRVHANANIYLQPPATLTFNGDVTGSGEIINDKKPGDPEVRSKTIPVFKAEHDSGLMTLNLPIGTANTPAAVREIVEMPPSGESVTSEMGKQRFYNNADLVILVKDTNSVVLGGGIATGNYTNLGWSSISNFVNLTNSFRDQRESSTMRLTEIDIAGLVTWNSQATNALKIKLNRDISSVYVADLRTQAAGQKPGIRLINGTNLPPLGLTICTPDPLYIKGNYNATGGSVGSTNTANTKPAALIADAISILSGGWNDANSSLTIDKRTANSTTVNAAFLAGIVTTTTGHYSGGVENFPRFLENWSNKTLTYNGSMIVLYESKFATSVWPGTGSVYNPPTRNWYFDNNFLKPAKLPPLTPSVRAVIRGQWANIAPNG